MKAKHLASMFLVFSLVLGCTAVPVSAAEVPEDNIPILRVSGRLDQSISANSLVSLDDWFYLAANDTIKYDCTYTPKSASVDFGYVDSNGVFHYLNCISGSFDKSFKVSKSGQYTLAIRNNSSSAVTVTGTVKY